MDADTFKEEVGTFINLYASEWGNKVDVVFETDCDPKSMCAELTIHTDYGQRSVEIAQNIHGEDEIAIDLGDDAQIDADGFGLYAVLWHDAERDLLEARKVCQRLEEQQAARGRPLTRWQPCGCLVCVCGTEDRCLGCGARHCGKHPPGEIPNPVHQPKDADPDETYVAVPVATLDLVRFLAATVTEMHDCFTRSFKLEPEAAKEMLVNKMPIIQGTGNQISIRRLGEQPHSNKFLGHAIRYVLDTAPTTDGPKYLDIPQSLRRGAD